jgi:hypothetical protein
MMRLFTAYLEVDDKILVVASGMGAFLAFIPAVQMVLYWGNASPTTQAVKEKKFQ